MTKPYGRFNPGDRIYWVADNLDYSCLDFIAVQGVVLAASGSRRKPIDVEAVRDEVLNANAEANDGTPPTGVQIFTARSVLRSDPVDDFTHPPGTFHTLGSGRSWVKVALPVWRLAKAVPS